MIPYYGDFAEDATVYMVFNTFTSDDPSASVTIGAFVNTDVHIHKDLGVAPRNDANGITVSVDHDGITGGHGITIDTSDDTVGGFWVVGSDYQVRIEGTTVDGATINVFVGTFSIENRIMGQPAGATLAADVAAVKAETALIVADTSELQVDDIPGAISGLNNLSAANVETACDASLVSIHLDHLLSAAESSDVVNNSVIAKLACSGATATWSSFVNTTDSLQAIRDVAPHGSTMVGTDSAALASGVDVTSIHGSALSESTSGYLAAAFVKLFDVASPLLVASDVMVGTDGANTVVPRTAQQIRDAMKLGPTGNSPASGSIDKHLDDIESDTDELQTDDIPSTLTTIGNYVDCLPVTLHNFNPSNDAVASVTAVGTVTTCTTTTTNTDMVSAPLTAQETRDSMKLAPTGNSPASGSVDKHLDDIETDTDELQTDDIPGTLTTIGNYVDCLPVTLNNFHPTNDTVASVTAVSTVATLTGHTNQSGDSYAIVNNGVYGNSPIETLVDEVETMLKHATYGLSALETLVDDLETRVPADYVGRIYQLLQNKLTFVNATGGATLRNIGNSADLATWGVTDNDTTTVRTEVSWA